MADPVVINPTLTLAGQAAAFNASGTGLELKITHVSFGTAHYDPTGDEVALVNPVGNKVAVAGASRPTPYQIRMVSSWREDVGQVAIGEIAWWAGETLVFVWSKADGTLASYKTDGVAYVLFNDLSFSSVPANSISFTVDPDESVALAALAAHEGAHNAHPQYVLRAKFPDYQGHLWGDVGGSANTITLTLPEIVELTNYIKGNRFSFKAIYTNTGATTINIDGVGPVEVLKTGGVPLTAGSIIAGGVYDVYYDGAKFQLTAGAGFASAEATQEEVTGTAAVQSTSWVSVRRLLQAMALKANLANPAFTGSPTVPTPAPGNKSQLVANTEFVMTAIASLVASSPAALDTLSELANALGNDPNFATTILNALALKAPLASPVLTGTPTGPTAAPGTNTLQLATTAFVAALGALKANLASPALTGIPTAPTAVPGTNTLQLATTAFVQAAVAALVSSSPAALDTLNELATALGNDPNFATTMTNALAAKAPLASPVLTGTPSAPTAPAGNNTTQLATTAFVQQEITGDLATAAPLVDGVAAVGVSTKLAREDHRHPTDTTRAPLASPALTGIPTAPTAPAGTNSTQLANTAFVQTALAALVASSPAALDTLNELAAALGNDPNFATTITNLLAGKQPLDSDLTALAALTTVGFYVNTGVGSVAARSITAGTGVSVANGNGVAGNPVVSLSDSGVAPGTYKVVTVGADGRVTGGTNPTTVAGLGIIDAVKAGDKALEADAEGGVDNTKWVTVAGVSVALSAAFAGCVVHFARNTAPAGFLKANGALVSRTAYSRLFSAIGTTFGAGDGATTFQLPDLRGLFVRGWDDGRGMNPGRVFATYETDELKSHAHDLIVNSTDAGGNKIADSNGAGTNSTASTSATGGTETRPRNLALLACIKY